MRGREVGSTCSSYEVFGGLANVVRQSGILAENPSHALSPTFRRSNIRHSWSVVWASRCWEVRVSIVGSGALRTKGSTVERSSTHDGVITRDYECMCCAALLSDA